MNLNGTKRYAQDAHAQAVNQLGSDGPTVQRLQTAGIDSEQPIKTMRRLSFRDFVTAATFLVRENYALGSILKKTH
jgi:hypothetical protein